MKKLCKLTWFGYLGGLFTKYKLMLLQITIEENCLWALTCKDLMLLSNPPTTPLAETEVDI